MVGRTDGVVPDKGCGAEGRAVFRMLKVEVREPSRPARSVADGALVDGQALYGFRGGGEGLVEGLGELGAGVGVVSEQRGEQVVGEARQECPGPVGWSW